MLGSQSGRGTSYMNKPIVASEQAGEKNIMVFWTFFSTRFRPDFCVKIQVTSGVGGGGGGGYMQRLANGFDSVQQNTAVFQR